MYSPENENQHIDKDILISCENVSKVFCRNLKQSMWYGARDIIDTLRPNSKISETKRSQLPDDKQLRQGEFWANKNITFSLRRGECLGLIGRNGAGKTTLLKMLNGIIKPDIGKITLRGRLGALIALGAGFNPILTGRENIIANAMVLGLTPRQIREQIDEIIDFSDLREFIDSPVRNYSSGMQVRLGFSIATVINPDILILDEVLAVGDASFRHKCYNRINKLIKQSAVILVSHSMDYVGQLATEVGLLDRGQLKLYNDVHEGIAAYNNMVTENATTEEADGGKVVAHYPPVNSVEVVIPRSVAYGEELKILIKLVLDEAIEDANLSFILINRNEQNVMCFHTGNNHDRVRLTSGQQEICLTVRNLWLHQGEYKWSLNMSRKGSIEHFVWHMRAGSITVNRNGRPIGDIPYLPDATDFVVRKT